MKIKIGSYPTRLVSNVHSRHMNNKYGFAWPETQDYEDYYLEAIEDMLQSFYNFFNWIWFDRRTQKQVIRIDKHDTWSMDSTLAPIILAMLKQLQETKHGAPFVDDKDVPMILRSKSAPPKENEWDTDDNHFKRWDWVLDEMIWAFEEKSRDDWQSDYYTYEEDKDAAFGLKLVWEDRKGQEEHQARISNGLSLFGKYYEGLWD